jgi:DNA invertase Pin-like site-specific DNA recombinase
MSRPKRYAVRYARWSSGEQGDGESLNRQDREFKEFCRKHDLEPLPGFELPPDAGISAYKSANIKKGSLADFLLLARSGQVPRSTVLCVENQDRLSRDKVSVVLDLFRQLIEAGICIGDCLSNRIIGEEGLDDAMTLMIIILGAVRAHDYSKTLERRSEDFWQAKRERAGTTKMTSIGPQWLRAETRKVTLPNGKVRNEVTGWRLVPDRVKVVKLVFELACQGRGCQAILDELERRGIATGKGKSRWHPAVVTRLIKDRSVLGEYQPCRRVAKNTSEPVGHAVKNYFPAIIPERTFDRANALLTSRNLKRSGRPPKDDRINIFQGILFDADSGQAFHVKRTYEDGRRVLKCKYGRGGALIAYEKLLEGFLMHIREIDPATFREKVDDATEAFTEELAAMDAKLATIRARVKAEKGGDIGYLLDIQRDLTRDKARVQALLEEAEARRRSPTEQAVKALREGVIADPENYRARLRLAVDRIELRVREVTFHDRPWKIGDATVRFRGGYTRVFCFIYKNTSGYLSRPLVASKGLRFEGHDPGPYEGLIREQHRSVYIDAQLGDAIEEFVKCFWGRYGPEDFAEWERWARDHPEEAARLQAESDEETASEWRER